MQTCIGNPVFSQSANKRAHGKFFFISYNSAPFNYKTG